MGEPTPSLLEGDRLRAFSDLINCESDLEFVYFLLRCLEGEEKTLEEWDD